MSLSDRPYHSDRIIAYLFKNPYSTNWQIAKALGMNPADVSSITNRLTKAGRISRCGTQKDDGTVVMPWNYWVTNG